MNEEKGNYLNYYKNLKNNEYLLYIAQISDIIYYFFFNYIFKFKTLLDYISYDSSKIKIASIISNYFK